MLKGQDLIVLLKLCSTSENWTVRSLEKEIAIPRSVIHGSLQRLESAGLYNPIRKRANLSQALEFLVHSVKYLFPPDIDGETRGVPTAWASQPLRNKLAPTKELPLVWPDPAGKRGFALKPVHSSVTEISCRDPYLAENIALIDALRCGDARVRELATDLIQQRLTEAAGQHEYRLA